MWKRLKCFIRGHAAPMWVRNIGDCAQLDTCRQTVSSLADRPALALSHWIGTGGFASLELGVCLLAALMLVFFVVANGGWNTAIQLPSSLAGPAEAKVLGVDRSLGEGVAILNLPAKENLDVSVTPFVLLLGSQRGERGVEADIAGLGAYGPWRYRRDHSIPHTWGEWRVVDADTHLAALNRDWGTPINRDYVSKGKHAVAPCDPDWGEFGVSALRQREGERSDIGASSRGFCCQSHLLKLSRIDIYDRNSNKQSQRTKGESGDFIGSHVLALTFPILSFGVWAIGIAGVGMIYCGLYFLIFGGRVWLGLVLLLSGIFLSAHFARAFIDRWTDPSASRPAASRRGNGDAA